jgi:four helix bundle protein
MNTTVLSYRDLIVWQKAMALVKQIYRLATSFPTHERYGLADQMRRSAVSIPSNIAEGQARQHTGEFRHFLYIALGSLAELETQVLIAYDVAYLAAGELKELEALIGEIRRMIHGLIRQLPK